MACYGAASSLLLFLYRLICVRDSSDSSNFLQIGATLVVLTALSAHPRHPGRTFGASAVDRQVTASLLERLTYSWSRKLLHIQRHRDIQFGDIPELHGSNRVGSLIGLKPNYDGSGRLWKWLLRTHIIAVISQWTLAFILAAISLAPQYATHEYLLRLEKPADGTHASPTWLVVYTVCSLVAKLWTDTTLQWFTASKLEIPWQSILCSLVYQKSLRLENFANDKTPDSSEPSADAKKAIINHLRIDT